MSRRITSAKQAKFLEVYEDCLCNISATCKKVGIHRDTFYRWMKDERFAELIKNIEEGQLDYAETKLQQAIYEGNLTAIIFYLKTKGKKRGYIESVEQNVKVSSPTSYSVEAAKQFLENLEDEY